MKQANRYFFAAIIVLLFEFFIFPFLKHIFLHFTFLFCLPMPLTM